MAIVDEIKSSFKNGNTLTKLIYVNVGVFFLIQIIHLVFFLTTPGGIGLYESDMQFFHKVVSKLAVPADISTLAHKPWTILTYMFMHEGLWHILFNMLILFWFGKIFLEYLDQRKLLSTYLLGGLMGALLYIASYNIFPVFETSPENPNYMLGASAGVLAIVIAIAFYVPNHTINMLFIGPVKLKYIALASILLDVINIASTNAGGHIAHLGGALFGFVYINQYRKGRDIAKGFNRFLDKLFSLFQHKGKFKVTHKRPKSDMEYNAQKVKKQERINQILDKIAKSGYDSLTKEEKEILFKMSDKN